MADDHQCKQEQIIAHLVKRLSEGHDTFAAMQSQFVDLIKVIGDIKGKLGFINGQVTMWGALAGRIAGLSCSIRENRSKPRAFVRNSTFFLFEAAIGKSINLLFLCCQKMQKEATGGESPRPVRCFASFLWRPTE